MVHILNIVGLITLGIISNSLAAEINGLYEFTPVLYNPARDIKGMGAQFPALQIQYEMQQQNRINLGIENEKCVSEDDPDDKETGFIKLQDNQNKYEWFIYCYEGECRENPQGHIYCDKYARY